MMDDAVLGGCMYGGMKTPHEGYNDRYVQAGTPRRTYMVVTRARRLGAVVSSTSRFSRAPAAGAASAK